MEEVSENEFLGGSEGQERVECGVCSRKFYAERIARHIEACERARDKAKEREKILKKKGLLEAHAAGKAEEHKAAGEYMLKTEAFY